MARLSAVEVFTKRATTVETIDDAFLFVMDSIEELGGRPRVEIVPMTRIGPLPKQEHKFFEVSVSATVEEKDSA